MLQITQLSDSFPLREPFSLSNPRQWDCSQAWKILEERIVHSMYLDYSYRSKSSRIERNYLIDIGKDSLSSIRLGFPCNHISLDYIRVSREPLETQHHLR